MDAISLSVAFVSIVISGVSAFSAYRSNKIAEEANKNSRDANKIAEEANAKSDKANGIAKEANEISCRVLAEQQEANRVSRELLSLELQRERERKTNPLTARGGFSSGAPRSIK